jgi:starch synthase
MLQQPEVCFLVSEIYPFSKTGGLADVMGVLPLTLAKMGLKVCVITPLYGRISPARYKLHLIYKDVSVGYPWPEIKADVYWADYHGMPVYFIDRGEYFDRHDYYCTYKGEYFDNCERFIFFCRACLALIKRFGQSPKILHAHDWHTALTVAYIYFLRQKDVFWSNTSTVLTIHNLAFQGRFSSRLFWDCGLPYKAWNMDGVEFYNSFNLLKSGIAYADLITTVSPTYAQEILTPEFGCGLEGFLQKRSNALTGILNGADYNVWHPEKDGFLDINYSWQDMAGKKQCKIQLLQCLGVREDDLDRPLLAFIGRLRRQKGIDLLLDIIPSLVERNLRVVVLGEGNSAFEARLMDLVEKFPGRVSGVVGYTEEMAHKLLAGADIFLMPSRYEPCGLTQMYSLRYGTPPVATAVGGLNDTIVPYPRDGTTGFIFDEPQANLFLQTIDQALDVFENKAAWQQIQINAMQVDFSWDVSARMYLEEYKRLGL